MRPTFALGLCIALLAPAPADAQLQVIQTDTRVHLRETASSRARSKRVLEALERLTQQRDAQNGWVPVTTANNESGWVSERYVFDPSEPAEGAPERLGGGTNIIGVDRPAATIDERWPKQRIKGSFLKHATKDTSCGPRGKGDGDTFVKKNRNDYPATSHAVRFSALRGLPHENGRKADGTPIREDRPFRDDDVDRAIARFDGIAITVTAFIADINDAGTKEGTNCQFTGVDNTDWHITLTETHRQGISSGFVVEPTPRFTQRHDKWVRRALRDRTGSQRSATDSVRITGFLFYDPDHRDHIEGTPKRRFTMWEIHPVTRIEIFVPGQGWVNLDNLP